MLKILKCLVTSTFPDSSQCRNMGDGQGLSGPQHIHDSVLRGIHPGCLSARSESVNIDLRLYRVKTSNLLSSEITTHRTPVCLHVDELNTHTL